MLESLLALAAKAIMTYQDRWIKGACIQRGERECEKRYQLIHDFCAQYKRPFTVLDTGAAQGYFSIRLTEDFDCTAVALESDDTGIAELLQQNEAQRVILLKHHAMLDELRQIAGCEHFDVVLGLSVLHHFGGTFDERLEVFRSLGDNLILEFAYEDDACGGDQKAYAAPPDAKLLGYGESHLEAGGLRKIVLLSRMKTSIPKAYIGSPRDDLALTIFSDFKGKHVSFYSKQETRPWARGLNLQTYLSFGGVFPTKATISDQIKSKRATILFAGHHDIHTWNVILQGDDSIFIDGNDPIMTIDCPDEEYFAKLIAQIEDAT